MALGFRSECFLEPGSRGTTVVSNRVGPDAKLHLIPVYGHTVLPELFGRLHQYFLLKLQFPFCLPMVDRVTTMNLLSTDAYLLKTAVHQRDRKDASRLALIHDRPQ